MAGTDRTKAEKQAEVQDPMQPAIILVRPQLGQNIGTACRAMLNCGLTDLRIVQPRDGWPNEDAIKAASGAVAVTENARIFDSLADALADIQHAYATTARARDMIKPVVTGEKCAHEIRHKAHDGGRCALVFGPERTGLNNDDLTLVDTLVTIPLNPAFSSLNLAQAVLLVGHEWYKLGLGDDVQGRQLVKGKTDFATKETLTHFFQHLEEQLDAARFFPTEEKKTVMVRNIRNMFQRMDVTYQEVQTLHGVITALSGRRKGEK